jgi:hypothetical protein
MVLVEEVAWELTHVLAVFEFGGRNLACVSEIAVFVQDFVNLVFDFRFEIEVL